MTGAQPFLPPQDVPACVSILDAAILASALVVGVMGGLYAGMGLNAPAQLDRSSELWFGGAMWVVAAVGAFSGGNLGVGMELGGLVLLMAWSVLHFPQLKTLETPMPRRTPLWTFSICLVTAILLGGAIMVDGLT